MEKKQWGGSRPKARSDDRRGGARVKVRDDDNRGRPAVWFRAEKEQVFIHERETIGGQKFYKPELWRVLSVSENEIEFQCGDDIIVIRRPNEYD
jgi:hypothetical protein